MEALKHIGVRVIGARLLLDPPKFGNLQPFVKLVYGNQSWRSMRSQTSGMNPKWNAYHSFPFTGQKLIQIIVFDTVFLIGEKLIGKCLVSIQAVLQGHVTEWWNLVSPKGELSGAVLLSFDYEQDPERFCTHCSSPLLATPQHRRRPFSFKKFNSNTKSPQSRIPDPKKLQEQLAIEKMQQQTQEIKLKKIFRKFQIQKEKIKRKKEKLGQIKDRLGVWMDAIDDKRESLEKEKVQLDTEKEEIQVLLRELKVEISKIEMEKLKLDTKRRVLDNNSRKLSVKIRQLQKNRDHDQLVIEEFSGEIDSLELFN